MLNANATKTSPYYYANIIGHIIIAYQCMMPHSLQATPMHILYYDVIIIPRDR